MKSTLKLVSPAIACALSLFSGWALADLPIDREHKDFWRYISDQERAYYWQQRKKRHAAEVERIREDDEARKVPPDAPTPVDLTGPPANASDKTSVQIDSSTSTIIGAKSQSTGKVLGGIKFADDGDDSDDARTGSSSLSSPFVPVLKSDGQSMLDDHKAETDSDKSKPDDPKSMLDSVDADYSDDQRSAKQDMAWRRLTDVHYLLNDWVPGAPDPTASGGFGIEEGNGRPVPYKLNGHPDPERKLPWKTAN